MDLTEKLKNKIKEIPDVCGVYIFKDKENRIIYVGKARSLRKRIQSYFGRFLSQKTQIMVSKIADIEYKITASEAQARLQEAALIKDKLPFYNISLKDDKTFPWIKITQDKFPAVSISRRKNLNKSKHAQYFGPYTNAKSLRAAFKLLRRIFGFRSCKAMPKKPCLYYRLNLCPGPCSGNIKRRQYLQIIRQIKLFLSGHYEELLSELSYEMKKLAEEKRFEEAAKIRDQIQALSVFQELQKGHFPLNELEDLRQLIKLKKLPERIEAFDISCIFGKEACGSMVSFFKGSPDKNNYRRFRIKGTDEIDDYKMLREVISRRYRRVKAEKLSLPDLVLIDGGWGHLKAAEDEINKLGLKIPLVS
ncbi:MAG: GIY-YIG nuclease family protein, partial [Candidatus Omnitrophica bacterium]|nr:GIY-YIG nuclease family protein [Candidatus Omnitrophota bacterium]